MADGLASMIEGVVSLCDRESNEKKRQQWSCPWPLKRYVIVIATVTAIALLGGYVAGQTTTLINSATNPKWREGMRTDASLDFPAVTVCVHDNTKMRHAITKPSCLWGSYGLGNIPVPKARSALFEEGVASSEFSGELSELNECSVEHNVKLEDGQSSDAAADSLVCIRFNGANLTRFEVHGHTSPEAYTVPRTEGKRNLTTLAASFDTPNLPSLSTILPALVYLTNRDDAAVSVCAVACCLTTYLPHTPPSLTCLFHTYCTHLQLNYGTAPASR